MTYCVGMRLNAGLVFLSDSRTNAGVDQISTFRKMTVFERPGERMLVLLTSGNLAISQSVVNHLREGAAADGATVWNAANLFEAAGVVGEAVRAVHARDAEQLKKFGIQFNCQLIVGGQIGDEPPRLFNVYSAGNFIEATPENPYFQIGEAKYGKPIIDRVLTPSTPLDEAAKCALISMDSTLRSNISVGLPLDLLVYETGALCVTRFVQIDQHNQYFDMIHSTWGARLKQVFGEIPDPTWGGESAGLDGNPAARVASLIHEPPVTTPPVGAPVNVPHRMLQSVAETPALKSTQQSEPSDTEDTGPDQHSAQQRH